MRIRNNSVISVTLMIVSLFLCVFFDAFPLFFDISIHHIDGQYQTFVGLDRLAKGQIIGQDFATYLGAGVLYFIYPLFLLFGKTVAASQFSASLLCHLAFVLSMIWMSYISLGNYKNIFRALAIASSLFIFYRIYPPDVHAFEICYEPQGSLLPLRMFLVILVSFLLYIFEDKISPKNLFFIYSSILGIAPLWSNDYGYPVLLIGFLIFIVPLCYTYSNSKYLPFLFRLGSCALIAVSSYFLVLSFITNFHALKYLEDNFLGFAKDQNWYFGPYGSYYSYFYLSDFFYFLTQNEFLYLNIMILLLLPFFRNKNIKHLFFIVFSSYLAALLSESNGHRLLRYWSSSIRCIPFFLIAVFAIAIIPNRKEILRFLKIYLILAQENLRKPMIQRSIFSSAVLLSTIILIKPKINEMISTKYYSEGKFFIPELGGYMDKSFKETIEFSRTIKNKKMLGEYYSFINVVSNADHRNRVDSIIHALGDNLRSEFIDDMNKVDFVVTTNPNFSHWLDWNFYINWGFYRELIQKFEVAKILKNYVVWKPKENRTDVFNKNDLEEIKNLPIKCKIKKENKSKFSIEINAQNGLDNYIGEVDLCYDMKYVDQKWYDQIIFKNKLLPIVYQPEIRVWDGNYSLNPKNKCSKIPVLLGGGFLKTKKFEIRLEPESTSELMPKSCDVQIIAKTNLEAFMINERLDKTIWSSKHLKNNELIVGAYTDNNYHNGVLKASRKKIRINAFPELKNYLESNIDKKVIIYGQTRILKEVVDMAPNPYFYIFVDKALDSNYDFQVGYNYTGSIN